MSEENKGFNIADIINEVTAEEKAEETPESAPAAEAKPEGEEATPSETPPEAPESPQVESKPAEAPSAPVDYKALHESTTKEKESLAQEVTRLQQGFQQVMSEVDKYLRDPKLYNEARIKAGLVSPTESPSIQPIPDPDINVDAIQDIPSLIKEVKKAVAVAVINERRNHEKAIQDAVARAEMSFRSETSQALQPHYVEKWKSAVSELSKEYEKSFTEVEADLRTAILRDPSMENIRNDYTDKKLSERQVLERAFKIKYEDRWLEHELQKRLAKEASAKASATEQKSSKTGKKPPSKSKAGSGKSLISEILEETDAELAT